MRNHKYSYVCGAVSIVLIGAVLTLSGCGKGGTDATEQSQAALPSDPLGVASLKRAFASANPVILLAVDDAVEEVRARHYKTAIEQFQRLSERPGLTDEQRTSLLDMISKLKGMDTGQDVGISVPK